MTDSFDLLQEEGNFDPHIWLDPLLAQREIEIIKEALKKIDYQNAFYYEEKAKSYLEELSNLDKNYKEGLAGCDFKEIVVVSHNAFGYLAKRYGLNVLSIAGLSPEQEFSKKTRRNF